MKNKHLFFCCYGGGHVSMLIPLIKKAQHEGHKTTILALTTAKQSLDKHNISSIGFFDLLRITTEESTQKSILELGHYLTDGKTHPAISQQESDAYHGLNMMELIDTHGEQKAYSLYEKRKRRAFFPVNTLQTYLSQVSPDIVIATNSPRSEKAAITAAGILNIPSLCIVDIHAPNERKWICQKNFATRVCVLNQKVKDAFVSLGRSAQDIVVTGNPAFDQLYTPPRSEELNQLLEKYQFKKNKPIILWASQPEPEVYALTGEKGNSQLPRQVDQALFKCVEKTDWQLIIRPHPSEQVSYESLPDNVVLSSSDDSLKNQLYLCDVLLTFSSTVGLEASLIDKPVFKLMMSITAEESILNFLGIGSRIESFEQLSPTLSMQFKPNTLQKENSKKTHEKVLASENIWNLITNTF